MHVSLNVILQEILYAIKILCRPHTNALIVQYLIYKEPTIFLPFTIVDLSKICVRFILSFAKVTKRFYVKEPNTYYYTTSF